MSETSYQSRIFVSYRRSDSRLFTERMHDRLAQEFGAENVFIDVDNSIPSGLAFADVLTDSLLQSDVVVVIIGEHWSDTREENDRNKRRLDNPEDWVRKEVALSLGNPNLAVIPVLIDGATLPDIHKLPPDLRRLCDLQAAQVRGNPDFHKDMTKLIEEILLRTNEIKVRRAQKPLSEEAQPGYDVLRNQARIAVDLDAAIWGLMQYVGYTADELLLNRAGKISDNQKLTLKMRSPRQALFNGLFWLALVGTVLGLAFYGLIALVPQFPLAAALIAVGVVEFIGFILVSDSYKNARAPKIEKASGALKAVMQRFTTEIEIAVADRTFDIAAANPGLLKELLEKLIGYEITVYFAGYNDTISLEIVRDSVLMTNGID